MAAFKVRPLLATTLMVTHVHAHVARRALPCVTPTIVVVQTDKFASIRLGGMVFGGKLEGAL